MKPWWKKKDAAMALDTWLNTTVRSGTDASPIMAVPAGMKRLHVEIDAPNWNATFQGATFYVLFSNDGINGPYQRGAGTTDVGGPRKNKTGDVVRRSFDHNVNDSAYPTHMKIAHEIDGEIECGFLAEFQSV